jgi:hypothetical protein
MNQKEAVSKDRLFLFNALFDHNKTQKATGFKAVYPFSTSIVSSKCFTLNIWGYSIKQMILKLFLLILFLLPYEKTSAFVALRAFCCKASIRKTSVSVLFLPHRHPGYL